MDEVRDSFRPSTAGWLRGTAAGLGTVLMGVAGFAIMIAKAGDWGAWPLALTGLAVLNYFRFRFFQKGEPATLKPAE